MFRLLNARQAPRTLADRAARAYALPEEEPTVPAVLSDEEYLYG
jgi:hypothetical protein